MNKNPIHHVVVTRPVTTATTLVQQLETLGFNTLSFPTVEIVGLVNVTAYFQSVSHTPFDIALFISPTAVHYAIKLCHLTPLTWPNTQIIAQGPGTTAALRQYGFRHITLPEKDYSSEGLLALSLLNNPTGLKIAIFKGLDGRGVLTPHLQQKGATVTEFNCYERRCPTPHLDLSQYISTPKNSLFIVTSRSGLHNLALLLHFAHPMRKPDWRDCHLLVISDKMRSLARDLGHKGKIDVADNASNEAILTAVDFVG